MVSPGTETNGMARILAQLGTATGTIRTISKTCRSRTHVKSSGTWCDVQHGWSEFHSAAQTMFEAIAEITADDQECYSWHLDVDALGDRISVQAYVCRLEKHGQERIVDLGDCDIGNLDGLERAMADLCRKLEESAGAFDFESGQPGVRSQS